MTIETMFQKDINRKINGVVKVNEEAEDVLVRELDEYVVTDDLRKHIDTFFKAYEESFRAPTSDIGVWISGFFGSGKSHFLKILSYLLGNREVHGVRTVERFREKLEDHPDIFARIEKTTQGHTDTILFNIDIEGAQKDQMAILRVFRKMFYNYLGYYGETSKIARLENFLDQEGKLEEFRRTAEEKCEVSWADICKSFEFRNDEIAESMQEILGMSKEAAEKWFDSEEEEETSIAYFVSQLKAYVDTKPDDFRLLFMMDEVGQYIGDNNDYLLNLQSMVEEIGSKCQGKVWIICTGQEALDEIIKTRQDAFSKIQARFGTRLSLTSTSADEVIRKRILEKTKDAEDTLKSLYRGHESVLRNIFTFEKGTVADIKGYRDSEDFAATFPFVPYQFTILQKVFTEIRKHGNSGKHLSGGERSMLSGFQEAAQRIKDCDEYTLAPFYLFYNTVQSFLDSSIRGVIERADKAVKNEAGLLPVDVDILKLLYLIRYIEDIPATVENIVILMTDSIRVDKIELRETVRAGLERLRKQNYIGQKGDTYQFLTDEEQDIQKEIDHTTVDSSLLVSKIKEFIYGNMYDTGKYRLGKTDFSFDRYVDGQNVGQPGNELKLTVYTVMSDADVKGEIKLAEESKPSGVIIVLGKESYYGDLEFACKVRKYANEKRRTDLNSSASMILRGHEEEAERREKKAEEEISNAIIGATFYVAGEKIEIKESDPKTMIDQAMGMLARQVYRKLDDVAVYAQNDADIASVLQNGTLADGNHVEENGNALSEIEQYLQIKGQKNVTVTMADVLRVHKGAPYGWREIDIIALIAFLLYKRKIDMEYGGQKLSAADLKAAPLLRKNRETPKIKVKLHQSVSEVKLRNAGEFLRDYFGEMNIPNTEETIVPYILRKFGDEKTHLEELLAKYDGHNYPDMATVAKAKNRVESILQNQGDSIALVDKIIREKDELLDLKDALDRVENFFATQVKIFDAAVTLEKGLTDHKDKGYLEDKEPDAFEALNQIRKIIVNGKDESVYREIPRLPALIKKVREAHERLLLDKRKDVSDAIGQCSVAIHEEAGDRREAVETVRRSDEYYMQMREEIKTIGFISLLDGLFVQISDKKDKNILKIRSILKEADQPTTQTKDEEQTKSNSALPVKKKKVKTCKRLMIFPTETIETEEEINAYVERLRKNLLNLLKDCDRIDIE